MKRYRVISPIKINGIIYTVNSIVELDNRFAYLVGKNLEVIDEIIPKELEVEILPTIKRVRPEVKSKPIIKRRK
jgi:hypothetical protein